MAKNKFFEMLNARWAAGARICIGLDSDPHKLPKPFRHATGYGSVDLFNYAVIKDTAEHALAYKLNIAFYSGRYAPDSLTVLRRTIDFIREDAPRVPVILDSKRGDIGNTNTGYVEEAFTSFDADAVTVNPYLGMEAMMPFLNQKDKGVILLCKTSNTGSDEFQDIIVEVPQKRFNEIALTLPGNHDGMSIPKRMPMYQYVAWRSRVWNRQNKNCALVVGATYPEQLGEVRRIIRDDQWILAPGIGTQGGDVETALQNGLNSKGSGLILSSSSGIIFAKSPLAATMSLTNEINDYLSTLSTERSH